MSLKKLKEEELDKFERSEADRLQPMARKFGFEIIHYSRGNYPECEMRFGVFSKQTEPASASIKDVAELRHFMRGVKYHARIMRTILASQIEDCD